MSAGRSPIFMAIRQGLRVSRSVLDQGLQFGPAQLDVQMLGPLASAVMNGKLTSVSKEEDSSILAFPPS